MKRWHAAFLLSAIGPIMASGHGLRRASEPQITWEVIPPLPSISRAASKAHYATNAASMAASEAWSADAEAHASDSMEAAAKAALDATEKDLKSKVAFQKSASAAERARMNRVNAEEVTMKVYKMTDQIPIIAQKAAEDAVKVVVAEAVDKMNIEANVTAEAALQDAKKLAEAAAKRAQEDAVPFQQAKMRNSMMSVEYAARARELAQAVIQLKGKSMEIANSALPFQASGNVVIAQQLMMKAHDLMDKALQMEGSAKGFQSSASSINNGLGLYDLAANAASSYGAYQENPAGALPAFPALPSPLFKVEGFGKI